MKGDFRSLIGQGKWGFVGLSQFGCAISPSNTWQLVDLFSFCTFQSVLQAVQHNFVGCVHFAIELQVSQSQQVSFDVVFFKECGDLLANESCAIVGDYRL